MYSNGRKGGREEEEEACVIHVPFPSQIVVTLVLCLRDWLMVLPVLQMARDGTLSDLTFRTVFEVRPPRDGS